MPKTLILVFHRDLTQSKANAALADAAARLPETEVVDMQRLYPVGCVDMRWDTDAEVARLLAADRIVLQFPIQWYSVPSLLKSWLDAVLTRMFYIAYEREGRLLEGKSLMVAATAGNVPESYQRDGRNRFTIAEMLTPLRMAANRCGLVWIEPFTVFEADKLSPERLAEVVSAYQQALTHWRRPQFNTRTDATMRKRSTTR
ncbi:MAG: NAD(P)H-dependent oxidoreductase [Sphingomonadales bacterium]|nr:NAD(P)H-dependent oxidoreductase [Sphingomonadales bacterium]